MDLGFKNSNKLNIASDHFVEENGCLYAGNHYLIDMWGCLFLENDKKKHAFVNYCLGVLLLFN